MYVYIIKGGDYYKIGVSKNPESRLSSIQTGNPFDLEIIDYKEFDNAEKVENKIHDKLNHFKQKGEWFNLNQNQIDKIRDSWHKANVGIISNKVLVDNPINLIEKNKVRDGRICSLCSNKAVYYKIGRESDRKELTFLLCEFCASQREEVIGNKDLERIDIHYESK